MMNQTSKTGIAKSNRIEIWFPLSLCRDYFLGYSVDRKWDNSISIPLQPWNVVRGAIVLVHLPNGHPQTAKTSDGSINPTSPSY